MIPHPLIAGLAVYGCYAALKKVGLAVELDCPPATQDPKVNRAHKEAAAKDYHYGPEPFSRIAATTIGHVKGLPLLVPEGHDLYWERKANRREVSRIRARKEVCGNCKAFNITPKMVACGGASEQPILVPCSKGGPPRLTTPVGYCEAHRFKCSALRTCDSWSEGGPRGGGPITDYLK
jgi:hypothetical protein